MNPVRRKRSIQSIAGIFGIFAAFLAANFNIYPTQAETGKGEDIFRVIMTIFEADKSKGDIVAIVTANNGEASKVKFLDTDALLTSSNLTSSTPSTTNPMAGGIIEYVATFPNVTVNTGAEYEACVMTTKGLELICTTGNNSPAARPEFVDISLNATSTTEESIAEEEESETGED
jgi:ABC-type Na+ efflux pump permease subunit